MTVMMITTIITPRTTTTYLSIIVVVCELFTRGTSEIVIRTTYLFSSRTSAAAHETIEYRV